MRYIALLIIIDNDISPMQLKRRIFVNMYGEIERYAAQNKVRCYGTLP